MSTDATKSDKDSTHTDISEECQELKRDIANAREEFNAEVDKLKLEIQKLTDNEQKN